MIVHTGELQAAIAAAAPGAILHFDGIETAPVVLEKSITLIGLNVAALAAGVHVHAPAVTLTGLQMHHPDPTAEVLIVTGDRCTIDGCTVHGHPTHGQRRGIRVGAADCTIRRSTVDDCFRPDQDAQAICGWDGVRHLLIEDCFLRGGAETVMIGGADPASGDRIPQDITIRRTTISKRPEWRGDPGVLVKNTLEFKNVVGALVEDCVIEYSWENGQVGYLLVLTPRNQDGTAPYSVVSDVIIRRNHFRHAPAAINLLGQDDVQPSQQQTRVSIVDNLFDDLDRAQWPGTDKLVQVAVPIDTLTIARNTFRGTTTGSQVYFYGRPYKATGFDLIDNVFPPSEYGIFGDGCSTGEDANGIPHAWNDYVETGTCRGNVTHGS